jgi:hypothetical protein
VKRSVVSVHLVRPRSRFIEPAQNAAPPENVVLYCASGLQQQNVAAHEEACACWYLVQPHYTQHKWYVRVEFSFDKLKRLLAYQLTPYHVIPINTHFIRIHQKHITAATHFTLGLLITTHNPGQYYCIFGSQHVDSDAVRTNPIFHALTCLVGHLAVYAPGDRNTNIRIPYGTGQKFVTALGRLAYWSAAITRASHTLIVEVSKQIPDNV